MKPAHIIEAAEIIVQEHYRCSRHLMSTRGKANNLPDARGCFAYLLHKYAQMSYPEIARLIGRAYHSTVHTAASRWKNTTDPKQRQLIELHMEAQMSIIDERDNPPERLPPLSELTNPPPKTREDEYRQLASSYHGAVHYIEATTTAIDKATPGLIDLLQSHGMTYTSIAAVGDISMADVRAAQKGKRELEPSVFCRLVDALPADGETATEQKEQAA